MHFHRRFSYLYIIAAALTTHCAASTIRNGEAVRLDDTRNYVDDYHRASVREDGDEDGKKWKRDVYEHTKGMVWCWEAYGSIRQAGAPTGGTDFYTYRVTRTGGIPNLNVLVGVYLCHAKRVVLSASKDNRDWQMIDEYDVPRNGYKLRGRLPAELWDSPEVYVRISVTSLPQATAPPERTCFIYDVAIRLAEKVIVQDGARFDFEKGLTDVPTEGRVVIDTTVARTGQRSLRLTATGNSPASVRLRVPRDPMGRDIIYVLTYWLKGDGHGVARVEVHSNRRKVYYRYWGDSRLGELQPAPAEWVGHRTYLTCHITAINRLDVTVAARSVRPGTVWFDAISLMPLAEAGKDLPPRPELSPPSREEISARARRLVPEPQINALYSFARGQDVGLSPSPGWQPFGWDQFTRMLSTSSYREHYADRLTQEGRLGVTLDRVRGTSIVPDHNLYLDRVPLEALDYRPELRPMLARPSKDDDRLLVFSHARKQWHKAVYESPLYLHYKKQEILDAIQRGALMFEVEPYGVNIPQMKGYHPLTEQAYHAWRKKHGLPRKTDLRVFPDGDGRDYLMFCLHRGMEVFKELSRFVDSVEPRIIVTAPHSGLEAGGLYRAYHLRDYYDVLFSEIQLRGMPKKDWAPHWMGRHKCKLYEYLPPTYETISIYKPLLAATGGKPVITTTYGFYGEYDGPNVELYVAEALSQKCSMDIFTPLQRMYGPIQPNRRIVAMPIDKERLVMVWTRVGDYFRFRKTNPDLYGPSSAQVAIVTAPSSWIQTAKGDEVHAIAVMGWCQAMVRNHIPFDCITVYDIPKKLDDYAVLIIPTMKDLTDEELQILRTHRDRLIFLGTEYGTCNELGLPIRRGPTVAPSRSSDIGYAYYHYLDGWRTDRTPKLEAAVLAVIPRSARCIDIGPKDIFAQLMQTTRGVTLHLVNYAMATTDLPVRLRLDLKPRAVVVHSPTTESHKLRSTWSNGVLTFTVPSLQLYTVVDCDLSGQHR